MQWLAKGCGRWTGVEKSSVKGVSLTTQRSTVLALDENGTPFAGCDCVAG